MRISQVYRNLQDEEGAEHILVFDDGYKAYLSDTRVVLIAPDGSQVGASLRAGVPGDHGELIDEFIEDGIGGFFSKDFSDDQVHEWLRIMGSKATMVRDGEVITNGSL